MENQNNQLFAKCWGTYVVQSSCNQKNIGAEFTHLHTPSLCKKCFLTQHNIGHSNVYDGGMNWVLDLN